MLFFTVLLHFGTLIAVFVVFWKDIWELLQELVLTIKDLIGRKGLRLNERPVRKLGVMIIVSCIPTAIMGFVFGDLFESFYSKPIVIAIMLIITAFLLIAAETWGGGNRTVENLNYRNSIFIGIVQGLAIIPGISRSGSTLFASLLCKLDRDFAVKFVFLISIPTILGSLILELPDGIREGLHGEPVGPVIVGVLVAFLSGLFAVKVMLKVVSNKKLKYFSYYLFAVAAAVIIYTIVK
jgi:undecaprenyl-diphosphatase